MPLNFFVMNKNLEVVSIGRKKISFFGRNPMEVYNFLFGMLSLKHPVSYTFIEDYFVLMFLFHMKIYTSTSNFGSVSSFLAYCYSVDIVMNLV